MKTMAFAAIVAASVNTCSGIDGGYSWDRPGGGESGGNSGGGIWSSGYTAYTIVVPGIPSQQQINKNPTPELADDGNITIPNFEYSFQSVEGHEVINLTMAGIKDIDGNWLKLTGTATDGQNIWVNIDGEPKAISLYNVLDGEATYQENKCTCEFIPELGSDPEDPAKPMVDIVFLVDNSESMGEEADAIARDLAVWANKLSQTLDVRFGCVGYMGSGTTVFVNGSPTGQIIENGAITGAIDLTTADKLGEYLNRATGVDRTEGFAGGMAADTKYSTVGECGVAALRYAHDKFSFRTDANRIYINVTDEPTQFSDKANFSSEWVKAHKDEVGTVYTIFSGPTVGEGDARQSSLNSADYSQDPYTTHVNWTNYYERPELLSEITGGSVQYASYDWSGGNDGLPEVKLDDTVSTEVTGALLNMHVISFVNEDPDLRDGKAHTVTIIIQSTDGLSYGQKTFTKTFE